MSLLLTTPWARQYLPEEMRPEVEAAIPEGTALHVGAGRKPGGPWVLKLVGPEGTLWRSEMWTPDLRRACLSALARHAE